jgi:hypothetical protein
MDVSVIRCVKLNAETGTEYVGVWCAVEWWAKAVQ